MRTAESSCYRNLISNLNMLNRRLEKANEEITSGSKLNHLHDAPASSAEMVQLQTHLMEIDQYQTNADQSDYYLQVSESALNSVYDLVSAIYSRGSAAATGVADSSSRQTIAEEIRSQRDQILSLANTQIRGRYLFSGSQTATAAFTLNGDAAQYHGDSVVNTVDISNGLQLHANVPGSTAFNAVFNSVQQLLTAIDGGDIAAIQSALSTFAGSMSAVSRVRTSLGVDLAKIQDSALARQTQQTNIRERQSHIGDADMAEAIARLGQTQTALQAALTAGSQINQKNLFDYLG
jgi:flagellar hook-associated protein 3 FlgL